MSCETEKYTFCVKRRQDEIRQLQIVNEFTGVPIDITDFTFTSQVKVTPDDTVPVTSITCTIVDGVNGLLRLKLTHTQTALFTLGEYVYDVKMTDLDGLDTYILEGSVSVDATVTA